MLSVSDPNQLARDIIHSNQYMTLATSNGDGTAWASAVVYVFDDAYNLYFISRYNSRHVRNLQCAPRLAITIFDSHQPFGDDIGVQIDAQATELGLEEALQTARLFLQRKWIYGKLDNIDWFTNVLHAGTYGMYCLKPLTIGMNNPNPKGDDEEDVRIDVKL